jgi:CheY-like chemotaxis protein
MSISSAIAPHLPYLRRFARMLSGSQKAGDAYVVATLEALVAAPEAFDRTVPPPIALYRQFLAIWNSINGDGTGDGLADGGPERTLGAITPRPRQAFLLATVESFGVNEIAEVLRETPEAVRNLLSEASREIASTIATDVLIIEDEPIIAMDLESLVEALGHRVTAVARTHREAVAAVHAKKPGLVLADVQLADGSSGLDAVNEILSAYDMPVIFVTAYPERLLTGERPEPTYLITKPFQTETLRAVIDQALFFESRAHLAKTAAG